MKNQKIRITELVKNQEIKLAQELAEKTNSKKFFAKTCIEKLDDYSFIKLNLEFRKKYIYPNITLTNKNLKLFIEKFGKNAFYCFLKSRNISFQKEVIEFGISGKKTTAEKSKFLNKQDAKKEIRTHYYSRLVRSGGWNYNILRAIKITIQ